MARRGVLREFLTDVLDDGDGVRERPLAELAGRIADRRADRRDDAPTDDTGATSEPATAVDPAPPAPTAPGSEAAAPHADAVAALGDAASVIASSAAAAAAPFASAAAATTDALGRVGSSAAAFIDAVIGEGEPPLPTIAPTVHVAVPPALLADDEPADGDLPVIAPAVPVTLVGPDVIVARRPGAPAGPVADADARRAQRAREATSADGETVAKSDLDGDGLVDLLDPDLDGDGLDNSLDLDDDDDGLADAVDVDSDDDGFSDETEPGAFLAASNAEAATGFELERHPRDEALDDAIRTDRFLDAASDAADALGDAFGDAAASLFGAFGGDE